MLTKIQTLLARVPLWIWCVLVFAAAVGIRVHWIQQKENFHCDESMSVHLCSYTDWKFENGKIFSGREVKDIAYANEPGVKDFAKDIFHLRENNRDYCHTNFYYSLLRAALYGADTTNEHAVIVRGFALNLALFSIAFVFLVLLLRELFSGKLAIVSGLVAGTLCTGTISMSMWIRPYDLSLATMLLFAFVFVRCVKAYRRGESLVSWKNLWLLAIVVAGTLLSVYFSIVAVVLLGATLCGWAWKKVGKGELAFLASVFVLGITVATAIYPNYPLGFLVGRGTEAASKFSPIQILGNIYDSFVGGILVLADDAMLIPALALLVVAVIAIRRERDGTETCGAGANAPVAVALSLFVPAFLAYWATLYLAPYKIVRYVAVLLPILLATVPWALARTRSRAIYILGNVVFIAVFIGGNFLVTRTPMRSSGDVDKLELRAPQLGVNHLVYRKAFENVKTWNELSSENSRFVILTDWRTHGLDLMDLPDSAQCVFVERNEDSKETFDLSNVVPEWKDFTLIIPTWGRVSLLGIHKIVLPKGTIGAETYLDASGIAIAFSRDESAPAKMLRLNEASAESGGDYFDVVPAN